jgi:hypothetical protein
VSVAVCNEQLDSHSIDICEILYCGFLLKFVDLIKVSLKVKKTAETFHEVKCKFIKISYHLGKQ